MNEPALPAGGGARVPGLQPERTSLSRRRSAVGASAVTALIAVSADRAGQPGVVVLTALVAIVLALAALALSRRPAPARSEPWPVLRLAGGAVIALGALGALSAAASILARLT